MLLVTQPSCFLGRGYRSIAPELVEALSGVHTRKPARLLLRLEAFLDLTHATLGLADVGTPRATEAFRLFTGSLHSKHFDKASRNIPADLRNALVSLGDHKTFAGWTFPGTIGKIRPDTPLAEYLAKFERLELSSEKLEYWSGWHATNLKGTAVGFRLHAMHDRLGHAFTQKFSEACHAYFSTRRSGTMGAIGRLDEFIGAYPTALALPLFQSRKWVGAFIRQFMKYNFETLHREGASLHFATDSWSDFAKLLDTCVLGKIWARPQLSVPRPNLRTNTARTSHIRKGSDGRHVKSKLITEVPLHISDSEAVELIWSSIQGDVDLITSWASARAERLWSSYQRRLSLAEIGKASSVGPIGKNTGQRRRISRESPDHLANAAATYQTVGHRTRSDVGYNLPALYPKRLSSVARELGIPDELDCIAFAALIVREHPCFNPSTLTEIEIFDSNEARVGFVQTGECWSLTGYKLRKGADRAETSAKPSSELQQRIEQLITLTQPLRDYLKKLGDPAWRRLFLYAETLGARPRVAGLDGANQIRTKLPTDLRLLSGLDEPTASRLGRRFTLGRLRASCAVLVYFQTRSVHAMAEALGHTSFNSSLLARYLPPILQEYFVERWVRLFQQGILCHALRESPALFKASGFKTRDELDAFLATASGIGELPNSTSLPVTAPDGSQVIFGVSPELLRTLQSLRAHVASAKRPVRAVAAMWSQLGELISEAVRNDQDLCWMLEQAETIPEPKLAEDTIYA